MVRPHVARELSSSWRMCGLASMYPAFDWSIGKPERPRFRGTGFMECRRDDDGLLRLDPCSPDHLAPLLGKFDNEFAELGGRACKWFRAQIDEPRVEHGISKGGINLLIEDRDDLRRRVCGGSNAIPTARLVTRHKIADRRDIREYIPQT